MRWTPFLINFQTLEAEQKKQSLVSRFSGEIDNWKPCPRISSFNASNF
jgi:hypothetical protein